MTVSLEWAQWYYASATSDQMREVWRRRVLELDGEPDDEAEMPEAEAADAGATVPELLALVSWNPEAMEDLEASGTLAPLAPAGQLTTSFTVPPSGNVLVRLSALAAGVTDNAAEAWAIHDDDDEPITAIAQANGSDGAVAASVVFWVTGLIADTGALWTWWHKTHGTGDTRTYVGGTAGPATMEVWSA